MKWKVLVSAPYMQVEIKRFRPIFKENNIEIVVPTVKERLEEEELMAWVSDIDGAICGDDRFTECVLQNAPRLKVICKWGTVIDSIDLDACRARGIVVSNTPNAFSDPVADTVMGYILCFTRNLVSLDRSMKARNWNKISGRALQECILGIIGVGNVGKAVVQRASAFGMEILGNDLIETPEEFLISYRMKMVSREELVKTSDIISLHCDLNQTSFHLIDDSAFKKMKKNAIIINTSRGAVIDEGALIRALKKKQIAGAAIDVFEIEPLPADSPLYEMDNVLLSPHNANSSPGAWERVHQSTIKSLINELRKSLA